MYKAFYKNIPRIYKDNDLYLENEIVMTKDNLDLILINQGNPYGIFYDIDTIQKYREISKVVNEIELLDIPNLSIEDSSYDKFSYNKN